jgi:type IV pilus assembly protein PilN
LSVGHFLLGSEKKTLTADVENLKKEIEKYREKNKEIAELEKKLKDLEQRTSIINNLEKNRYEPVYILDEMTKAVVPDRMWITRLVIRDNSIQMDGLALDNQTVANFMDRLQVMPGLKDSEKPFFSKVNLKRLQLQTVRNTKLKSFLIVCDRYSSMPTPAPAQ